MTRAGSLVCKNILYLVKRSRSLVIMFFDIRVVVNHKFVHYGLTVSALQSVTGIKALQSKALPCGTVILLF